MPSGPIRIRIDLLLNFTNTQNMKTNLLMLTAIHVMIVCCTNVSNPDTCVQITESDIIKSDSSMCDCILDSWEPVFLDDSSVDALLGDVVKVRFDDGLFFIESMNGQSGTRTFKVFDRTGRYIRDISHPGRARNEYVGNITWTLDPDRNEVAIIMIGNPFTVKYFDYEGNFLRTVHTDTLSDTCDDGFIAHIMSDGSILMESLFGSVPTNEFIAIHPDGQADSIVPMRNWKLGQSEWAVGIFSTNYGQRYLDSQGGETWFMRALDHHLYRLSDSGQVECVANLAFLKDASEEEKLNFEMSWFYSPEFATLLSFVNMKDMLQFTYGTRAGVRYVYDKNTGSLHEYAYHKTDYRTVPELIMVNGVYDNTIIGAYTPEPDEDEQPMQNSPELEAFYRRAAQSENPTLVLYHF